MTKDEVIEEFCALAGRVREEFDSKYAADCFCLHAAEVSSTFNFDKEVFQFIENAVQTAVYKKRGV